MSATGMSSSTPIDEAAGVGVAVEVARRVVELQRDVVLVAVGGMVELVVQRELEGARRVVGERDVEDQPVAGVEAGRPAVDIADELGAVLDELRRDEFALRRKHRATGVRRGRAGRGDRCAA